MPAQNRPPCEGPAPGLPPAPATPEAVLAQLAHVLGLLAMDLLPLGLAVGDVESLLLKHYVAMAAETLGDTDDAATTCSIAIATGLSRHRVNQLRHRPQAPTKTRRMNRALRVAEGWLADPAYHPHPNAALPPPVPYAGPHSFCALVRRHSGDIPPGAMRKFMVAAGMLEVAGTGPQQQLWLKTRPLDTGALEALAEKLERVTKIMEA